MVNKKIILVVLFLILINTFVLATTLEEQTLNSINPGDIIVNKGENICKSYSFSLNKLDSKSSAFLQLFIKNYIPASESVKININLNGDLIKSIENKEINNKNIIELEQISNNNHLEICIENNYLPRLIIDSDSLIGNYYVAKIDDNDFYQETPSIAYTNTLIPIKLIVNNSGYDDIYIEVINATEKFIYNSNLENVSGETSYKGILKQQENISLNYFVKTDLNKSFATPLAKLKYTDRFGQEHIKYLNTQIINLIESEGKLQVYIDTSKKIEPYVFSQGHLIIRNTTENVIEDVYITPYFGGDLILDKDRIIKLNPKDVVEIPFKIKTYKENDYTLSFNINYLSENKQNLIGSQTINLISENKENKENTATIILIMVTIMLFIWIVKI